MHADSSEQGTATWPILVSEQDTATWPTLVSEQGTATWPTLVSEQGTATWPILVSEQDTTTWPTLVSEQDTATWPILVTKDQTSKRAAVWKASTENSTVIHETFLLTWVGVRSPGAQRSAMTQAYPSVGVSLCHRVT